MLIAHLPAGYIVSVLSFQYLKPSGIERNQYLSAGMIGAIAPDLDMIYFYCIDHRSHSHHSYFSHFPVVWLMILIMALSWLSLSGIKNRPLQATILAANGLLHMLLDFLASNIYWLAPFVMKPFSLTMVDRIYEPWWLNFIFHRSFLLELIILTWAALLFRKDWNSTHTQPCSRHKNTFFARFKTAFFTEKH
jgi:hypothetical protein